MSQNTHLKLQDNLENLMNTHQSSSLQAQQEMESAMHEHARDQEVSMLKVLVEKLLKEVQSLKTNLGMLSFEQFHTSLKGRDGRDGKPGEPGRNGSDADEEKIISRILRQIPIPKNGRDGKNADENKIISEILKIVEPKLKSFVVPYPPRFAGQGGGSGATFQGWVDLAGAVNGSNVTFTLSSQYPNVATDTETIVLNGLVQLRGTGNDYTISLTPNTATVATVTFATAPPANRQSPRIMYQKG